MANVTTFVGLDVHKKSITAAVAMAGDGAPRLVGAIPNEPRAVAKLVRRLGRPQELLFCYEAGPCGYALQRQIRAMEYVCIVVAPSLVPRKPGDRVKTDRRDALKLAKSLRSGELTAIDTPDPDREALRDLTRAREVAQRDLLRIRHRISKMLLRCGITPPSGLKSRWTLKYEEWLASVTFDFQTQSRVWKVLLASMDQAKERVWGLTAELKEAATQSTHAALISALQCLRGVGLITALTWVAELGDIAGRFLNPRSLMGYAGLGVKEWSSGERTVHGGITKTGNSHVRFVAIEAAWHYRHSPKLSKALQQRRKGQPEAVIAIAEKAEGRLHKRFWRLVRKGKAETCAATAIGREMMGFVWAIACAVQPSMQRTPGSA